jgi:hypothetical protein
MKLSKANEQALRLFLTGETTDLTAIAQRVGAKRSEVARWSKRQDWTALKDRMATMVKQGLAERIGSVQQMNSKHLALWGLILQEAGLTLITQAHSLTAMELNLLVDSLTRALVGIRLACEGGTK